MECKFGRGRIQTNLWRELIDTLWNVNVDAAGVLSEYDKELIDTLWNVNNVDKVCFHREGSRN